MHIISLVEALVFAKYLTLQVPSPQNSQTHSKNSSGFAEELLECVWLICAVGAQRVKFN